MTVTITAGDRVTPGSFQKLETLNPGTSTVPQAVSVYTDVTEIAASTATFNAQQGRFVLPTLGAVEGQRKVVVMAGTGQAVLQIPGLATTLVFGYTDPAATATTLYGPATGGFVMTVPHGFVDTTFMSGKWHVMGSIGASMSTGSATS